MWGGLTHIGTNLGMHISIVITIVLNLAWIIFIAKDLRLGLIMWLLTDACLFMAFYGLGWAYEVPLTLMFIAIVALALRLFFTGGVTSRGGGYI